MGYYPSSPMISCATSYRASYSRRKAGTSCSHELTDANSKLLGGFNLEDYDFPSMARLGVVRRVVCAKAEKVNKRWDNFLDMLIDGHVSKSLVNHGLTVMARSAT